MENIIFLNTLNDYWKGKINKLRDEFSQVSFIIVNEDRKKYISEASGIVTPRFTVEQLEIAEKLKIIFVPFTGVNYFPLDALKERKIIVSNAHGNSKVVAERAVALALAVMGRINEYSNDLKEGIWHRYEGEGGRWHSIQGKVCGLLGVGHVGKNIGRILQSFNCRVIGFRKHTEGEIPEFIESITDDLLYTVKESDVIFVSLPLTDETRGLIDRNLLSLMKNKYIINVGRGAIIDEKALYDVLLKKDIGGAGLDVWYNYPREKEKIKYPSSYPIYRFKNVVVTPHNASNTGEARKLNIDDTVKNVRNYLKKGVPYHRVDLSLKY